MADKSEAMLESAKIIAHALRLLGNADAATPMGAIEAHGVAIRETGEKIAGELASIAEAIDNLAEAMRETAA